MGLLGLTELFLTAAACGLLLGPLLACAALAGRRRTVRLAAFLLVLCLGAGGLVWISRHPRVTVPPSLEGQVTEEQLDHLAGLFGGLYSSRLPFPAYEIQVTSVGALGIGVRVRYLWLGSVSAGLDSDGLPWMEPIH